jgi:hypothetical protein
VLFGVYYTFSRRLQQVWCSRGLSVKTLSVGGFTRTLASPNPSPNQVVQQGLSVKSDWLFAADVDKHSSPSLSATGLPLSPSHPFRSAPPLVTRNSFDLRFD